MQSPPADFLTTREVAQLLRIKERKVYDLVATDRIPCTRATGKLLFSRAAIDAWLGSNQTGPEGIDDPGSPPDVILGSHDPLLEWALNESDCGIASNFGGSLDGLQRFADAKGIASALHLFEPEDAGWNVSTVRTRFSQRAVTLIEFCWRERGLILLSHLLEQEGIDAAKIQFSTVAHNETEAASAVLEGLADAALGLRALAERYQLEFIPLMRERFDLLIDRRAWFEMPLQTLAQFCRSPAFSDKAASLPGYETRGFGTVHFNG